ncbi:MAG: hypothetical protein VW230_06555 [Candidatus Poseidoniales archaeon]
MNQRRSLIENWCMESWGELPTNSTIWSETAERTEMFFCLSSGVLIAVFSFPSDDEIQLEQHLHIPISRWNVGSIQADRAKDGKVRFRHMSQSIMLSAEFRAPEWGRALLEEWLMTMRSESTRPKDRSQRLATVERLRSSVERNLKAASLENAQNELEDIKIKLQNAENRLAGSSSS